MVAATSLNLKPLLEADNIARIGLTKTQIFFLVGQKLGKGLCRFVKRDKIKDAISTLLAIRGKRKRVEDILLTDTNGLKVFTDQGIEYLPSAELPIFLTRYNQVATAGCDDECNCQEDTWRHICPHKIKNHLLMVKEKIEAMTSSGVVSIAQTRMKREVMNTLTAQDLTSNVAEDDGEIFIRVTQNGDFRGVLIIAEDGSLSVQTGSGLIDVGSVEDALAHLCPQPTISAEQWNLLKQLAKGKDGSLQLLSKEEFEAIILSSEYLRPLNLGEEPSGSKILVKHFDTLQKKVIDAASEKIFQLRHQPLGKKLYEAIAWTEVEKLRINNPGVLRKFQELLVATRARGLQLSELIAQPFSVCLIDKVQAPVARFSLSAVSKCWQFERYINGRFGHYQVVDFSLDDAIDYLVAKPEQLDLLCNEV